VIAVVEKSYIVFHFRLSKVKDAILCRSLADSSESSGHRLKNFDDDDRSVRHLVWRSSSCKRSEQPLENCGAVRCWKVRPNRYKHDVQPEPPGPSWHFPLAIARKMA
jgi:hypothetical protein